MKHKLTLLGVLAVLAACATPNPSAPTPLTGTVVFTLGSDVYRITANPGSSPENLSALVWGSPRKADRRINASSDGAWLVWETRNADPKCETVGCLIVAPSSDPKATQLVKVPVTLRGPQDPVFDAVTVLAGIPAIASGGNLIVYPFATPEGIGLFTVRRAVSNWSNSASITAQLGTTFNDFPSLSNDGGKVVFDCGDVPYGNEGTDICQLNTDGTGFVRVFENDARSRDSVQAGALHHPAFTGDGSVVFEASWNGEQLWRAKKGDAVATRISSVNNDNSPCVLSDGRVVSLWLDRPGNSSGAHELRVVNADGSNPQLLLSGQDISDIGIGCGK